MAITVDARNTGAQSLAASVNSTTMSWNHTLGAGSNALLIAIVAQDAAAATTSVVWDDGGTNVAMTKIGSVVTGSTRAEIWYLKNPATTGTKAIKATWSGTHHGNGGSISLFGVDQSTTFNAASPQTATGATGTDPSLTVTSASGQLVIDSWVQDNSAPEITEPVVGAGQNYIIAHSNTVAAGSISSGGSDEASTGATVAMTWDIGGAGGNGAWAQVGISLIPDAGGGTIPPGQSTLDTRLNLKALVAPDRGMDYGYIDGTEIWLLKGQDVQFGARGQWKTYDWPNPTVKKPNLELRWWFERYKLMLIGRDVLPAVMDDQPNPTLKRDDINRRTFTDSYKLMLIGRDTQFGGAGQFKTYDWPNPVLKRDDINRRWHWWNPLQTLLTLIIQNPFALLNWPNPLTYRPKHQDTQGWYVLSLIGKDSMPFAQPHWPNPRIAARAVDLLTHIWNPLYQLLTVLAAPFAFFDWVVPRARPRNMQDHSESYPLTLIGQDALPFDLTEWPNPQQPRRAVDLGTHLANGLLNLLTVIIQAPFVLLNWPNPLGRRHPQQGSTDMFKPTLIGKDALPFRVTEWPVPQQKRWGISLRGFVDGLRRWLPIPAPTQFPGKLAPGDARVGTLSMADLSAHITVIEVSVGRTTVTDAEAPIGPSDAPSGTIKVSDKLLN